jgi:hypothetical protein
MGFHGARRRGSGSLWPPESVADCVLITVGGLLIVAMASLIIFSLFDLIRSLITGH